MISSARDSHTVDAEDPPAITFGLPGEWAGISMRQDGARESLISMLRSTGLDDAVIDDLAEHLKLSAASGADRLLIRQSSTKPTMLLTGWPGIAPTDIRALRSELGLDDASVQVESRSGYSVLRSVQATTGAEPGRLTYWVVHPRTARILTLGVTFLIDGPSADDIELYDAITADISWEE